jgi:hypothetical protein
MKVAVSGYRHYNDYGYLSMVLGKYDIDELVLGDASGTDGMAQRYAKEHSIDFCVKCAKWSEDGNYAGPLRNGRMLDEEPELLVAFLHPSSRGTRNMIKQAKERGITTVIYNV